MKYLIHILLILLFGSCFNQNCETNLKELKIDGIGTIEVGLPSEFDKEYKSIHYSELGCEFIIKGFICSENHNLPLVDTTYELYKLENVPKPLKVHSIEVSYNNNKCGNNLIINKERLDREEQIQLMLNVNTKVLIKKLERFNNLDFLILGYRAINDSSHSETLRAETKIDSTEVTFLFQKVSSDSTNFINDMNQVLKTLRKI